MSDTAVTRSMSDVARELWRMFIEALASPHSSFRGISGSDDEFMMFVGDGEDEVVVSVDVDGPQMCDILPKLPEVIELLNQARLLWLRGHGPALGGPEFFCALPEDVEKWKTQPRVPPYSLSLYLSHEEVGVVHLSFDRLGEDCGIGATLRIRQVI